MRDYALVQVVECVGDANCHLHSSLRGQFLNSCISFFPKGLRVILIRQTRNLPFLENRRNKTGQVSYRTEYCGFTHHVLKAPWRCSLVIKSDEHVTLKSLGKTSVGWPRITNRRELSLRRLESKSSRLCSKNLEDDKNKSRVTYARGGIILRLYWITAVN